jgi:predicted DNA-binding protein (MmcQ/YjbR family)
VSEFFYTIYLLYGAMQYYNEEKMHSVRVLLEQQILSWPDVSTKKMYGCPCYKYKDKLFAFLVTDGVVLTKASEQDKANLGQEFQIKPFQVATRTMKGWPQIPIDETSDLERIIWFIKKSYEHSKSGV